MKHLMAQITSRGHTLQAQAATFWSARNAREQRWLSLAGAVILIGLLYGVLIDPALSGKATLTTSLPALRQQTAHMQAMQREIGSLSVAAANNANTAEIGKTQIEATLARKGLRPQNLAVTGDTVRLQFTKAAYSDLLAWIADMQKDARLSLVDASFASGAEVDVVDARLTLQRLKDDQS